MIHRTAHFIVKQGNLKIAKEAIIEFVNLVNENEPDCVLYRSLQSTKNEFEFIHYMIFKNTQAEDHHRGTDYVNIFVDKLYPLLDKKPEFTSYNLIRG